MIAGHASAVDIDDVHSAAICKEIGQRLEGYYKTELSSTSVELERLIARLRQLDQSADPAAARSE